MANVIDFGADPTGAADSHDAIMAAIAAIAPSHGVVFIPAGHYKLGSTLHINVGVSLIGAGGTSQEGGSQSLASAATILAPDGDFAAIWWETDGSTSNGWWSKICDLAIVGTASPVGSPVVGAPHHLTPNAQHGIVMDNGGLYVRDVTIAYCGGHGIYLRNSVKGHFLDIFSVGNHGDGIRLDDDPAAYGDPSRPTAVTLNQFTSCGFTNNGGDGIRLRSGATGNVFVGCDSEGNLGYAISISNDSSTGRSERNNRWYSQWEENNGGLVHIGAGGGSIAGNWFDFAHATTPDPDGWPNGDLKLGGAGNGGIFGNEHSVDSTRRMIVHQISAIAIVPIVTDTDAMPTVMGFPGRADPTDPVKFLNWPDMGGQANITVKNTAGADTLTFRGALHGMRLRLCLIQGTGGCKHVVFAAEPGDSIRWRNSSNTPPTLSTSTGMRDYIDFEYDRAARTYFAVAVNAG